MKKLLLIISIALLMNIFCNQNKSIGISAEADENNKIVLKNGIYADLDTTCGNILISLEYEKTPLTVTNFIGLAEGTINNTARKIGAPYFDGALFHRVVANFVIQTGDPTGKGEGGPGYNIPMEIHPDLKHDTAGTVGMARSSDPNSNGSQFYITHCPTPHLDDAYIVFGKVVKGMDAVNEIKKGDKLNSVKIIRIGEKAKKFLSDTKSLKKLIKKQKEKLVKQKQYYRQFVQKRKTEILTIIKKGDFKKTQSGLRYYVLRKGSGIKARPNRTIKSRYIALLKNGKILESSYEKGVPFLFRIKTGQLSRGLDEAYSMMRRGGKWIVIIPAKLAIKGNGKGTESPQQSDLIYELELVF